MTKQTNWPEHPAKTQVSLSIHPVWSVVTVHPMGSQGPKASESWFESSLGGQVIVPVLTYSGSYATIVE